MKSLILLSVFVIIIHASSSAQKKYINVAGLHQLVANNETEFDKQNQARDQAAIVTAHETANRTILESAKQKFVDLANRYNTLGTAIDVANIGLRATPTVNHIIQNQAELLQLCEDVPAIAIIAYTSEVDFLQKSRSLVNFLIGLSASAGVVNQMKMADRRILFAFVMSELNDLRVKSNKLVNMCRFYTQKELLRSANPFQNYIDRDKEMVKKILDNYKGLTK